MSLFVDIKKQLGDFTLDVKFQTKSSETVSLFGLSGSGKSITLKCIAGIVKPDSGRIVINDTVLFDSEKKINLPPQKRNIGYLPQSYGLFPNMTVKDNIKTGLLKSKNAETLVYELIERFELQNVVNLYPHQLSGGQQQRVALARALATTPDLLLLDEPFSSLDTQLKSLLMYDLIKTLDEFKSDVVFVSHDKDEVYSVSDKVCTINNGYCHTAREKIDVFTNPLFKTDAVLIGVENIFDITLKRDNHISTDSGIELKIVDNPDFNSIAFYSDAVKLNTTSCDINKKAKIKLIVEKEDCCVLVLQCDKIYKTITANVSINDSCNYKIDDIVDVGLDYKDIFLLK